MIRTVETQAPHTLADYEAYSHLAPAVEALRAAARAPAKRLRGRTVWMVNSTEQGGGVAEMLPQLVGLLRELGVDTRWAVIEPNDERFFALTKRVHNLLHGTGDPHLTEDDTTFFADVSRRLADCFVERLGEGDLVVAHDPQPVGLGALVKERTGQGVVWRCHIGLDDQNAATEAGWSFLRPWLDAYDQTVFTLPAYVPAFLDGEAEILHPAIDPLSPKNHPLRPQDLASVLMRAGLLTPHQPVLEPPFEAPAQRLQPGGGFAPVQQGDDLGLLFRPLVLQVSRWDRLKGWGPLLTAFARLKQDRAASREGLSDRHRRRLDLVRLVLAGPEPDSVQDDPEGLEVFRDLCARWQSLDADLQHDVALLSLPMQSRDENALMVNALQRCATIVVQNSLREGFGLTATEAMWKGCPVLASHAAGLREQVVDGQTGRLAEAEDPHGLAATLDAMLEQDEERAAWGRNATRRVYDRYLVFTQVRRWLEVLGGLTGAPAA